LCFKFNLFFIKLWWNEQKNKNFEKFIFLRTMFFLALALQLLSIFSN